MAAHTTTMDTEILDDATRMIAEVTALQEMATRIQGDNEEDFDMLQRASAVSMRMLEEVTAMLQRARMQ